MKGSRIRLLSTRLALAMTRATRAGTDIRAKEPRKRPLVLVWALGLPAGQEGPLLSDLDRLLQAADVTVVTDSLQFETLHLHGCMIEALPSTSLRARLPAEEWATYIENRMTRIRASWQPDLEIHHRCNPDMFLAALARPGSADRPAGMP